MANTNGLKALVLVISLLGIGSAYGLGPEEAVDVDYNKAKKILQQRAAEDKRLSQEKIDAAERKIKELEAALQREKAAASDAKKLPAPAAIAPVVAAAPHASSFADPFAGEMVAIPLTGRPFSMGGWSDDEKPVHPVTIRRAYELGRTEVTQGQWKAVMGNNPSNFKTCGDNCPVESVSWDDIQQFLTKLNEKTGKQYRLPSEAEWEYACRAGGTETYCGSNDIDAVAWYGYEKSGKTVHPVAKKQKNAFGLYDMSGNVWEWVQDCYHDSYHGAPEDGSEWKGSCYKDTVRVPRGGSWLSDPGYVRSANRSRYSRYDTAVRSGDSGFRLARTLP